MANEKATEFFAEGVLVKVAKNLAIVGDKQYTIDKYSRLYPLRGVRIKVVHDATNKILAYKVCQQSKEGFSNAITNIKDDKHCSIVSKADACTLYDKFDDTSINKINEACIKYKYNGEFENPFDKKIVSDDKAFNILNKWIDVIISEFQGFGLTKRLIKRHLKMFHGYTNLLNIFATNPYLLVKCKINICEIVWKFGISLGVTKSNKQDKLRKERMVYDSFIELIQNGDMCYPLNNLSHEFINKVRKLNPQYQVEEHKIDDKAYFYLREDWDAEQTVAKFIGQQLLLDCKEHPNYGYKCFPNRSSDSSINSHTNSTDNKNIDSKIDNIDVKDSKKNDKKSNKLDNEQTQAVEKAISNYLIIIEGSAGTGKTTSIRSICQILDELGKTYYLTCFSGKAASRLRKGVNGRETYTTHRLINKLLHPKEEDENPIIDYIIIDEDSMISIHRLAALIKAMNIYQPEKLWSLVLLGDLKQLLPIKSTSLVASLKDVVIPKVKLLVNHRFESSTSNTQKVWMNNIISLANKIDSSATEQSKELILNECQNENSSVTVWKGFDINNIPFDKLFQTLYNKYRKSKNSNAGFTKWKFIAQTRDICNKVNKICQQELLKLTTQSGSTVVESIKVNPGTQDERHFNVGDRVIITKNNYALNVFNGQEAIVASIDTTKSIVYVKLDDEDVPDPVCSGVTENSKILPFPIKGKWVNTSESDDEEEGELTASTLELAYCLTVHKSQGSEWEALVAIVNQSAPDENFNHQNMLYTMLSRCTGLYAIVIDKKLNYVNMAEMPPRMLYNNLSYETNSYIKSKVSDSVMVHK